MATAAARAVVSAGLRKLSRDIVGNNVVDVLHKLVDGALSVAEPRKHLAVEYQLVKLVDSSLHLGDQESVGV